MRRHPEDDLDAAATGTDRRPDAGGADLGRYPWVAMGVILGGTYLFVLDTTVLGVALPDIARDLPSPQGLGIDWVVTAYLVAVGSVQPATGWMADRWGKKRIYISALAMFTLGSVLAGLAPSLEFLVVARAVQGFGGGAMQPVGMAIIYELFPADRRGTALGVWGVAIMAAPALGPPLGGWVTTAASWRWIFLVNLPIGLFVLWLARRKLRETGTREYRTLDGPGWVLAATGLVTVVIAFRQAPDWGVTSPTTLVSLVVGAVLLAILVRRSLRMGEQRALLDFRMFTIPTFTISMVVVGLLTITQFGRLTFLPVEFQYVRGMGADEVGLLLAPPAVAVALTMPLGGWLADRIGARVPVVTGMSLLAVSSWFLGHLEPTTTQTTIILILMVGGLGSGLAIMPNTVAAMNSLPTAKVAQAAAIRAINRQVAGAAGTALLAAVLVASLGAVSPETLPVPPDAATAQAAYNRIFIVMFWILVAAATLGLFLPGRTQMRQFQDERAEEHAALARELAET